MKKFVLAMFSALLLISCHKVPVDDYAVSVVSPSGAPGVALADFAVKNPDACTFIDAETIPTAFIKAESDFIVAPVNAGAKLFKAGKSSYQLAAVVTWGNLYFASQLPNFVPSDIAKSSEVYFFGENTINASIAKFVLAKNDIALPDSVTYLAGAANTQTTLLQKSDSIVLTADPLVTAAKMKNPAVTKISVQDLYKEATGNDGFTQAGLFVNPKTLADHPDAVAKFLSAAKASCDAVNSNLDVIAQKVVELQILGNSAVAKQAIPGCNIRFVSAKDARAQVEMTAQVDIAQFGGALPADEFYYAQ